MLFALPIQNRSFSYNFMFPSLTEYGFIIAAVKYGMHFLRIWRLIVDRLSVNMKIITWLSSVDSTQFFVLKRVM